MSKSLLKEVHPLLVILTLEDDRFLGYPGETSDFARSSWQEYQDI